MGSWPTISHWFGEYINDADLRLTYSVPWSREQRRFSKCWFPHHSTIWSSCSPEKVMFIKICHDAYPFEYNVLYCLHFPDAAFFILQLCPKFHTEWGTSWGIIPRWQSCMTVWLYDSIFFPSNISRCLIQGKASIQQFCNFFFSPLFWRPEYWKYSTRQAMYV